MEDISEKNVTDRYRAQGTRGDKKEKRYLKQIGEAEREIAQRQKDVAEINGDMADDTRAWTKSSIKDVVILAGGMGVATQLPKWFGGGSQAAAVPKMKEAVDEGAVAIHKWGKELGKVLKNAKDFAKEQWMRFDTPRVNSLDHQAIRELRSLNPARLQNVTVKLGESETRLGDIPKEIRTLGKNIRAGFKNFNQRSPLEQQRWLRLVKDVESRMNELRNVYRRFFPKFPKIDQVAKGDNVGTA